MMVYKSEMSVPILMRIIYYLKKTFKKLILDNFIVQYCTVITIL